MISISVIILSWNGKRFLDACLGSLAEQSCRDFEVVLVDNGSTDGTSEYIQKNYPWVKLVMLPENTGFSAGNNHGLLVAQGRYIITLNNDTKVKPDFIDEMVKAVEANPRIGMVAAKMLNYYEPGRIDSVGVRVADNGLGYNIGVGEQDVGQYEKPAEVFGACAGAALYRREMVEEVGFFDPDFFAYYEDLDLAWRGRLSGWLCVAAPRAVVLHVHSATSGKMSPFTVYHLHRNKWYTVLKNWPVELLLKGFPKIVLFDLASIFLAVSRGRGTAAIRARIDLVRNFRQVLAKRRVVQSLSRLTVAEVAELFSTPEGAVATFARKVGDR